MYFSYYRRRSSKKKYFVDFLKLSVPAQNSIEVGGRYRHTKLKIASTHNDNSYYSNKHILVKSIKETLALGEREKKGYTRRRKRWLKMATAFYKFNFVFIFVRKFSNKYSRTVPHGSMFKMFLYFLAKFFFNFFSLSSYING